MEKRLFYHTQQALDPRENLALNSILIDEIANPNSPLEMGIRLYKHEEGIILGKSQSTKDINCLKEKGLKVAQRDTGGAAVYVHPEITLCYSLFFDSQLLSSNIDYKHFYKEILSTLAANIGENISYSRTHYIAKEDNNSFRPLIGNAQAQHLRKGKRVIQIDGILHFSPLPLEELEKTIKLRRLHSDEQNTYVETNGEFYLVTEKELLRQKIRPENINLLRDEREEINQILTLNDLQLTEEEFAKRLYQGVCEIFGETSKGDITNYLSHPEISRRTNKYSNILDRDFETFKGHCFVYFPETQDRDKRVIHP